MLFRGRLPLQPVEGRGGPDEDIKLQVPLEFRRGALRKDEQKSVAQGVRLVRRIGEVHPLEGARILDFGCGVKIAQALYQLDSPQELYVGVDVYDDMVKFLQKALAHSPKYKFATVPFQNAMYNEDGAAMTPDSTLPIDETDFSMMLMFSVITHMVPQDSAATFAILRRYAAPDCRLIFWAFANDETTEDFRDLNPKRPLLHAVYRRAFLNGLIEAAGWKILTEAPGKERPDKKALLQTHYVCTPA